jgi:hypothetical protein
LYDYGHPKLKEDQDGSEAMSVLRKGPHRQSSGEEAEENLWISLLPEVFITLIASSLF